jgi:hypothetical protein
MSHKDSADLEDAFFNYGIKSETNPSQLSSFEKIFKNRDPALLISWWKKINCKPL